MSEPTPSRFRLPRWVPRYLGIVGVAIAIALLVMIILPLLVIAPFFRTSYPPQPTLGYTGEWRLADVIGVEERPLPSAEDLWRDYEAWQPKTQHARRLYLARLGDASRQLGFQTSTNRGDTPLGAQDYTYADFIYVEPTNGTYAISWTLRGKHDASFLRFDTNQRLYQLQPYGSPNDKPPRLSITAIEGVKPGF